MKTGNDHYAHHYAHHCAQIGNHVDGLIQALADEGLLDSPGSHQATYVRALLVKAIMQSNGWHESRQRVRLHD